MAATAETKMASGPDRLAEIEALRRRGRLGEAMAACQDLLLEAADDPRLLLLGAAISRDGRHYIRAASYLDRLTAAQPADAPTLCEAARIWRQCGNKEAALAAYREALRLDPISAPAHFEIAEIQSENGQAEDAIYHLEVGIAVDPNKLDAREQLAGLLEATGKGGQAADLRRETMRRAWRRINADYTRIRTPAAASSPRTLQRHRLSWAHALLIYGTAAMGVAKFEEAAGGIDAAAATYREALGVLAEGADQARSVAGLRRAFATASLAYSRCHYEMALLQERRNDLGGAIHHLEEALRAHGSPWAEVYEKLGALVGAQNASIAAIRDLVLNYTGQPAVPAAYPVSRWDFARQASAWGGFVAPARAASGRSDGRRLAMLAALPEELQIGAAMACVLAARGHNVDILWWPGLRFDGTGDPEPRFDRWDEALMAREVTEFAQTGLPEGVRLLDIRDLRSAEGDDAMEREAERLAAADIVRQRATGTVYLPGEPTSGQRRQNMLLNLHLMRRVAAYLDDADPQHLILLNGDMMAGAAAFWTARKAGRKVIVWERSPDRPSAVLLSCNRTRADRDFMALWQSDGTHELSALRRERVLAWLSGRTGGDYRAIEPRKRHLPSTRTIKALSEHALDPMRPVAVVFGDRTVSAGEPGDGLVFSDGKDWMLRTVDWFEQHPDWQLVLRLYGQDGPMGIRPALRERWPDLPRNVRIVESGDVKLDYLLLEAAQVGIYRTNPIGLEMAMMGIIAVTAGRPFFAGKGFTQEARDPEDYFRLVRRALESPGSAAMTDHEVELAWCFADLYIHAAPKAFPWSDRHFWRDIKEEWPMSRLLGEEGSSRFGDVFAVLGGEVDVRDGIIGTVG
jgi:tetratricopeptide (TPR) repeat protein